MKKGIILGNEKAFKSHRKKILRVLIALLIISAFIFNVQLVRAAETITLEPVDPYYLRGDKVYINGTLENESGGIPYVDVGIEVKDSTDGQIFKGSAKTNDTGYFSTNFIIPDWASYGECTIYTAYGNARANTTFRVCLLILMDNTPTTATTGDPFTFNATVTDNIGVSNVYVYYWYGTETAMNVSMIATGIDDYYEYTIIIPSNSIAILHYNISAVDDAGNWNQTGQKDVPVTDNDAPEISNVNAEPDPQEVNGYVNITCDVTDNIAVDEVWVNITYPDSSYHNFSMSQGSYHFNQTYSMLGIYHYFIWANDTSENWNISSTGSFSMVDSTPPELGGISISLPVIPEDTDGVALWGELTNISVVITDDSNIASVVINLTSLGGSLISMHHIDGTNTWYIETNASIGSAIWNGTAYVPHVLEITATDEYGNCNIATVELTVVKNGDVNGDGIVTGYDARYIMNWKVGNSGFEVLK